MAELSIGTKNMIYTPDRHIPVGEAVKMADGEYGLRIKRAKSQEVDIIPISKLYSQVINTAEARV